MAGIDEMKAIKVMLFGVAAIFLICAVFAEFALLSVIWAIGALILAGEYVLLQKKTMKMSLGRLKERVGSDSVKVTTRFLDDCIEVVYEGETTETVSVKYEIFCSIIKHDVAYILRTEYKQAVMIFRENLTAEEEEKLFAFLKTKPTIIKWK